MPIEPVSHAITAGFGCVGPQVAATLLFGHRHTQRGALFGGNRRGARITSSRSQTRRPNFRQIRRITRRRHRRVSHCQRASHARLQLRQLVRQNRMSRMPTDLLVPSCRRIARLQSRLHHRMVARVKLHPIYAPTRPIKRLQSRQVPPCICCRLPRCFSPPIWPQPAPDDPPALRPKCRALSTHDPAPKIHRPLRFRLVRNLMRS